jgi:SAM-dependent methyltransferase
MNEERIGGMAVMDTSTGVAADAARDALVGRLFQSTIGALELLSVQLGVRLGLYNVLREHGSLSAAELAERAGIDARYAREWLEQQAVAGLLATEARADERRFRLPDGFDDVLVEPTSPAYAAPFAALITGIAGVMPRVVDAYRSGGGVPYADYGPDMRDGQGAINRPAFTHELASWIAAIPDVHARLLGKPPARIADLGCGQGYSTIALAEAYPVAAVDGVDTDAASIEDARRNAAERGADVAFAVRDASGLADSGPYDLVCIFEALHDMAQPVEVLAAVRAAVASSGAVLIADERVADTFTAPGDEIERMMYGWSVTHCLPASRSEPGSAALGTVLRADTVRRLASEAGYATVDVLPIENDFFRFYCLRAR